MAESLFSTNLQNLDILSTVSKSSLRQFLTYTNNFVSFLFIWFITKWTLTVFHERIFFQSRLVTKDSSLAPAFVVNPALHDWPIRQWKHGHWPTTVTACSEHVLSYPSSTSSIVNVLTGDLALVARLGALGVLPRFGDVLALLPAGAALPPFFFCSNVQNNHITISEHLIWSWMNRFKYDARLYYPKVAPDPKLPLHMRRKLTCPAGCSCGLSWGELCSSLFLSASASRSIIRTPSSRTIFGSIRGLNVTWTKHRWNKGPGFKFIRTILMKEFNRDQQRDVFISDRWGFSLALF